MSRPKGFSHRSSKDIARAPARHPQHPQYLHRGLRAGLSFVLDIADRILVMEGGRIVHSDTRDHVDEAAIARFLAV